MVGARLRTSIRQTDGSRPEYLGRRPRLRARRAALEVAVGALAGVGELRRTRATTSLYPDTPRGFPGNDDLGTMSAWYAFAAIGLYPEIPGTDVLAVDAGKVNRAAAVLSVVVRSTRIAPPATWSRLTA